MDEVVTAEPDQAVREVPTHRGEGQTKKRAPGNKFGTVRLAATSAHWEVIVRAIADTRGHATPQQLASLSPNSSLGVPSKWPCNLMQL